MTNYNHIGSCKEFDQSLPDWVEIKSPATKYFLNWTNIQLIFIIKYNSQKNNSNGQTLK